MLHRAVPTLALFFLLNPLASYSQEPVPTHFDSRWSDKPAWLSVSELVTPEGEVRWELLRQYPTNLLGPELAEKEQTRCIGHSSECRLTPPGYPNLYTLETLTDNAHGIFRGTVTAIDHGFYNGNPGSLLQVRLEKTIKGDGRYGFGVFGESFYGFHPEGRFRLGPLELCPAQSDLPPAPGVGDGVVVFDADLPRDEEGRFLAPFYNSLFTESAEGELIAPQKWKDEARALEIEDLGELVEFAEKTLQEGES